MKTLAAVVLLALTQSPLSAWAQGAGDVRDDLKQMQALDAKHADAVQDLNAKEKAAMEAVKDDKSLTPEQRKEKLAAIRADFQVQRRA